MSDNNKYDGMPFHQFPIQSDGLKVGLRDYFAAKAMEGIIANSENITNTLMWLNLTDFKVLNISDACELSYLLADAMLAEREKERA
jgi:hypothetical protein